MRLIDVFGLALDWTISAHRIANCVANYRKIDRACVCVCPKQIMNWPASTSCSKLGRVLLQAKRKNRNSFDSSTFSNSLL